MRLHALTRLLLVTLCLLTTSAFAADKRPNILWIITEDMGPELACYGTPEVSTPVLDDLARRGVRYANAFTVTPVCSTSRSGFCTGMYPITTGAHQHRTSGAHKKPLPEGTRPITHRLQDAGYYTANIRTHDGKRVGTGKVDWDFEIEGRPFQGSQWEDLKGRQPFYAQINFSQSHRGWGAPAHADPDKVKLPPYYPDHLLARQDWAEYLDEITEVDGLIGNVLESLKQDGLADNTIVIMFGDHGRAHVRGKQWCYDSGLAVPMIVYIPPGLERPKNFQPGSVDERLIASIDVTATTLDLAGVEKPASMQGRIFLGPNSDPDRRYAYAHRDRCDMTTFRIRTVRDKQYRYIRNFMPERPFFNINMYKERSYPMIALMRSLHAEGKLTPVQDRLFAMTRPSEELYFIGDDPYEVRNLAESKEPKHQAALKRLRGELGDWIERTGDAGRVTEDPAIGLAVLEGVIGKSSKGQLENIQGIVEQQRASPGISDYYRGYLDEVQERIDAAAESAPEEKSAKSKKKRRRKKRREKRAADKP